MKPELKTKLSLIRGKSSPNITEHVDLIDLLKRITTDEKLLKEGKQLREFYKTDVEKYNRYKGKLNGFILGDFSYRDDSNCLELPNLLGFDLDHLDDKEIYQKAFSALKNWSKTFLILPSVSGLGMRVIVKAEFDLENFSIFYKSICKDIEKLSGLRLKSSIREGLKIAGYTNPQIEKVLDETPHVDDQVGNLSRFWFFSGVSRSEIYMNMDSPFYEIKKASPTPQNSDRKYVYEFSQKDKIDYLISKIKAGGVDITAGWREWFKIGCSIASEFGDEGRELFHEVSQFHPDYNRSVNDREYNRILKKADGSKTSIGSFYKACSDYGVVIDYSELTEQLRYKFPERSNITITENESGTPIKAQVKAPEVKKLDVVYSNEEAERSLIRQCLRNPDTIFQIMEENEKFGYECFSNLTFKSVFAAIQKAHSEKMEINLVSIGEKLKIIDPKIKIEQLKNEISIVEDHDEHVLTNVKIVFSNHTRNQLLFLTDEISSDLSQRDSDIFEYLAEVNSKIGLLSDYGTSRTEKAVVKIADAVLRDQMRQIERFKAGIIDDVIGLTTGYSKLNELTLGYQPTHLIIRAGRPGMGKTASALSSIVAQCRAGKKVGFFSLEMGSKSLVNRLISQIAEIDSKRMKRGAMYQEEIERYLEAFKEVENFDLWIDDKASASISYIETVTAKWVREHDIDIIYIDYLGLITAGDRYSGQKVNETSEISRALKKIAKSRNIPVMALHQLSRAVETRGGNKKPQLSDLRDSGAIEQDADIVEFVFRPEYYLEDHQLEFLALEGTDLRGKAQIDVAKCRDGSLGTAHLKFTAPFTKFEDWPDDLPADWEHDDVSVLSERKKGKRVLTYEEIQEKNRLESLSETAISENPENPVSVSGNPETGSETLETDPETNVSETKNPETRTETAPLELDLFQAETVSETDSETPETDSETETDKKNSIIITRDQRINDDDDPF